MDVTKSEEIRRYSFTNETELESKLHNSITSENQNECVFDCTTHTMDVAIDATKK